MFENLSTIYYQKSKKGYKKGSKKISKSSWRRKKKQQYGYKRYKSLPEHEKHKLVKYRKYY